MVIIKYARATSSYYSFYSRKRYVQAVGRSRGSGRHHSGWRVIDYSTMRKCGFEEATIPEIEEDDQDEDEDPGAEEGRGGEDDEDDEDENSNPLRARTFIKSLHQTFKGKPVAQATESEPGPVRKDKDTFEGGETVHDQEERLRFEGFEGMAKKHEQVRRFLAVSQDLSGWYSSHRNKKANYEDSATRTSTL
ncbi:hypothetical protein BGZ70_006893 [Mortierella alpina]|uniref:Uncharacterized protein n=1 Tax=Mortierella alpina TaxID=64518 RepID=A0A9P6J7P4_MORAP|nr:hypothetical protein BGZ70_006893 [Mortierella alpina]